LKKTIKNICFYTVFYNKDFQTCKKNVFGPQNAQTYKKNVFGSQTMLWPRVRLNEQVLQSGRPPLRAKKGGSSSRSDNNKK